jgi:hypothetical protein
VTYCSPLGLDHSFYLPGAEHHEGFREAPEIVGGNGSAARGERTTTCNRGRSLNAPTTRAPLEGGP